MMQYAGKEMLRRFAQAHQLSRSVCRLSPCRIDKAHVNVYAVADEIGVGLGREDDPVAQPMRGGARHLPRDHRMIGGGQGGLRHDRNLELARRVRSEKSIRNHPGCSEGCDETLAKSALPAKRAEGVGVARPIGGARVEEFLLECRVEAKARRLIQLLDGASQEVARTAFPGAAVGIADIAEKEMLDCRTVSEIDPHLDGRVGHDHQIPGRAKGGVPDRPKGRHHQIAAGPAHALLEPPRELAQGKTLAAYKARDVASPDKDEFFSDHAAAKGAYRSTSCRISSRLRAGASSNAPSMPAAPYPARAALSAGARNTVIDSDAGFRPA